MDDPRQVADEQPKLNQVQRAKGTWTFVSLTVDGKPAFPPRDGALVRAFADESKVQRVTCSPDASLLASNRFFFESKKPKDLLCIGSGRRGATDHLFIDRACETTIVRMPLGLLEMGN
jgi:hypothetical protein